MFFLFTNDLEAHLPFGKRVMYVDDVQFIDSDTTENLDAQRVEDTLHRTCH